MTTNYGKSSFEATKCRHRQRSLLDRVSPQRLEKLVSLDHIYAALAKLDPRNHAMFSAKGFGEITLGHASLLP